MDYKISVSICSSIGAFRKEVDMSIRRNRGAAIMRRLSLLNGNQDGVSKIMCPFFRDCRFGERKKTKSRPRCDGKLFVVYQCEAILIVAYKCRLTKKTILLEIKNNAVRLIPAGSPESDTLMPRLKPLACENCQGRMLDLHHICGEVVLDVKCQHDRHEALYPLE